MTAATMRELSWANNPKWAMVLNAIVDEIEVAATEGHFHIKTTPANGVIRMALEREGFEVHVSKGMSGDAKWEVSWA